MKSDSYLHSSHRCCKCGAELVALDPERIVVWPYDGLQLACPTCDGPFECVSVVKGWFRRVGKESE